MLSTSTKQRIAQQVQDILQSIDDDELPQGEIHFILHVDGAAEWSWANIRNMQDINAPLPRVLTQNLTVK